MTLLYSSSGSRSCTQHKPKEKSAKRPNVLFILVSDPTEEVDLSKQNPGKTQKLFSELGTWLNGVNAQIPEKDTIYNESLAAERKRYIENEWLNRLGKERLRFLSNDFTPNKDWCGSKVTND